MDGIDRITHRVARPALLVTGVVLALSVGVAAPAQAKGSDAARARGNCSRSGDWELRAKSSGGRLEIRFDVDAGRRGQKWTYTLRSDGSVLASGTRTARSGGLFRVEVRVPATAGTSRITATARNSSTREYCRAAMR